MAAENGNLFVSRRRFSCAETACYQPILGSRANASNLPGPYIYSYQKAMRAARLGHVL